MKPFTVHSGLVAPMDRANVDTDLMIPKQFLKSIKRSGFGPNLFDELRYLDEGVAFNYQITCSDLLKTVRLLLPNSPSVLAMN